MDKTVIVQPGQCLADIAVQSCGSLSAWVALADLNNLAITAQIYPGQVLKLPEAVDKRAVAILKSGDHFPAAGQIVAYGEGIGWWIIENDFIVQ